MSNPEVERAAEFRRIVRRNALPAACDIERSIDALETGLLLAGLLRTEADRLNEDILAKLAGAGTKLIDQPEHDAAYERGLDILDARKPVERWTVAVSDASGALFVLLDGTPANKSFPRDAEPEARAYVARKNAEEAERAK